jgi:hypothetical protein
VFFSGTDDVRKGRLELIDETLFGFFRSPPGHD